MKICKRSQDIMQKCYHFGRVSAANIALVSHRERPPPLIQTSQKYGLLSPQYIIAFLCFEPYASNLLHAAD